MEGSTEYLGVGRPESQGNDMSQKHAESLRYEDNTVFTHGYWERYEYLELLDQFNILARKDRADREDFKYSFVQDSFYALSGCEPTPLGNGFVLLWNNAIEAQWFKKLQALFDSGSAIKKLIAVRTTSHAIRYLCGLPTDKDDIANFGVDCETPDKNVADQIADDKELLKEILNELNQEQKGNQGNNEQTSESQEGSEEGSNNPQTEQTPGAQSNSKQEQQGETGQGQEQSGGDSGNDGDGNESTSPFTQAKIGPTFDNGIPVSPTENMLKGVIDAIGGMAEKAELESDAAEVLLSFLPGVDKDLDDEIEIADYVKRMNFDHLKYLTKMLGFARSTMLGAKRSVDATTGELTKYRHVSWSDNLHPVDRVGLATSSLRAKVQLAEGTLRARNYEDHKPKGRGPVILLRDETRSMSSPPEHRQDGRLWVSKHNMALSLEIALASVFNQEKRDLVSIPWTGTRTRRYTYGEPGLKNHLDKFFYGSSTLIEDALQEGVKVAGEYVDGADIVVLTDGQIGDGEKHFGSITEDFLKNGGRIWVILFDVPSARKMPWASGIIRVDDLADNQAIADLLTQVNRKELNTVGKKVKL